MKDIDFSKMAEFDLMMFDLSSNEEELVDKYLKNKCTFKHKDAYEYIIHLYQSETEPWFIKHELSLKIPQRMIDVILEARRQGAARICFYS